MRPLAPLHTHGLLPRVPAAAGNLQHPSVLPSSYGGQSSRCLGGSRMYSSCSGTRQPSQVWAGLRQGPAGSSDCGSRHAVPQHAGWGYTHRGMSALPSVPGLPTGSHGVQLPLAAVPRCGRHPSDPVVAAADATPAPAASSSSSPASQVLVSTTTTSSSSSRSEARSRRRSTDSNTSTPHASSSSSQQNEPRPPRTKPKRRSKEPPSDGEGEGDPIPPELTTIERSPRQQRLDEDTRQQLALLEEKRVQQAQRDAGRGSNWQPLQGSAEDDQQQWEEQQGGSSRGGGSSSSSGSKKGSRSAGSPAADKGPASSASKQQQVKKQDTSGSSSGVKGQEQGAVVPTPVAAVPLSPLHWDIKDFASAVVLTQDELLHKKEIIQMVQRCVHSLDAFDRGGVRVAPFGSFVTGLGTWDSDIDLVITGLLEPDRVTGGFAPADKRKVVKLLQQVAGRMRKLKKLGIRTLSIVPSARIPIIKAGTRSGVNVDISLGDGSGPRAANFVRQQMAAYAPLAPLVLTLKVFLRAAGLNEVANGGLSSFSLTNMVLAHLQEDLKAGQDIYDLGESLYGFFCRYGDEFDYDSEAVSVASGGIVRRDALSWAAGDGRLTGDVRLAINDPLTGRDVSAGTYRMGEVRNAFAKAARRLEAMVASSGGGSSSRVNYLACLFDPVRAVDRRHGSSKGAVVIGGRPAGLQDLSFQDADSLLYEELDITGDEDQLDDWAQGSWVGGAGGRRR